MAFLHISKREQRRRLAERLADPDKAWKFSAGDVQERALWGATSPPTRSSSRAAARRTRPGT